MLTRYNTELPSVDRLLGARETMIRLPALYREAFVEELNNLLGSNITEDAGPLITLIANGSARELLDLLLETDSSVLISDMVDGYNWEFESSETEAEPGEE